MGPINDPLLRKLTMAGDVIMKTNLCNLLQLNNATAGASGRAV
jgi:hypothetical protein